MTNLFFIRHGEALTVKGGIVDDYGLTEIGRKQAERLRDRLIRTGEIEADALLASSNLRARQTAEIIAPALRLPVEYDDDFQELRPGEAIGLLEEEVEKRLEGNRPRTNPFGTIAAGAENWPQFVLRVGTAIYRIGEQYDGKTVAIVCHGGVIDCAFQYFFGLNAFEMPKASFHTNHTSITRWSRIEDGTPAGGWLLAKYNDDMHLHIEF